MARKSLVGVVADELLDRIIAGEFPPGASVPGELELSARHEVSRMTVREAMKTLEAQRILSVERGRGTFVNPLNRWSSLEAVLRAASEGQNEAAAAIQLIELRRMLETGACELAARTDQRCRHPGLSAPCRRDAAGPRGQRPRRLRRGRPRLPRPDPAGLGERVCGRAVRTAAPRPGKAADGNIDRCRTSRSTPSGTTRTSSMPWHPAIPHRARDAMDAHMQQTLDDLKKLRPGRRLRLTRTRAPATAPR